VILYNTNLVTPDTRRRCVEAPSSLVFNASSAFAARC